MTSQFVTKTNLNVTEFCYASKIVKFELLSKTKLNKLSWPVEFKVQKNKKMLNKMHSSDKRLRQSEKRKKKIHVVIIIDIK